MVTAYLALILLSFLLSFGAVIGGHKNYVFTILYDLGLLKFARYPARFFIPLSMGLAVLGGMGLDRLMRRVKKLALWRLDTRFVIALAFCAFLTLEVAVSGLPFPRISTDDIPQAYRWMAGQGDLRMVSLPTEELAAVHIYDRAVPLRFTDPGAFYCRAGLLNFYNTANWTETMDGYSGYVPFSNSRSLTELQGFPSSRSIELLEALDIEYVVWHWEWVPEEKMEYCEKQFATLASRLMPVEKFGDQEIFNVVNAGKAAGAQDLEIDLATPEALPAGETWHLGLMVTDPTNLPYASIDEEYHTLRLAWLGEGGATFEQEAEFHTPFFLGSGETWTVAMDVTGTPSTGEWELTARIEGGALDGREFNADIAVKEEIPFSSDPIAHMDARLDLANLEGLSLVEQDGLFTTEVALTNTGKVQWLADVDGIDKVGVVRLAMTFQKGAEFGWEEQRFTLPCDVSPGQTVTVPVLLRVPRNSGNYHLSMFMMNEAFFWFGPVTESDMEIAGP